METRQRVVGAMIELLRRQGYAATGIKELAQLAAAPTGSIYHHFKGGKRDVAGQALIDAGGAYLELVVHVLGQYDDPVAGVEGAFREAAAVMEESGWLNMCPVGTVLGEVADVEPELRATGDRIFRTWVDAGAAHYETEGLDPLSAREFTHALVGGLEGAFVLARTQRSREPLHAAGRTLARSLRALLAEGDHRVSPRGSRAAGSAR